MSRPKLELLPGGKESMFDPFNDAYVITEYRKAMGLPVVELVETQELEERKSA